MRFAIPMICAAIVAAFGPCSAAEAIGIRGGGVRAGAVAGPRGGVAAGGASFGAAAGPFGGAVAGGTKVGAVSGPLGGARVGGASAKTVVGPAGGSIQAGHIGGASVGPLGGVHAGGASGVKVTTPGGNTFGAGSRLGGTAGPLGGVAVGGAHVASFGHATNYVSPVTLRSNATYVRTGVRYDCFNPTWFQARPTAWVPARWRVPNIWVAPVWPSVATFCNIVAPPIVYDYGSNVVINNNYVYVNGDPTYSTEAYATQALNLADQGRQAAPPMQDEWQPLGVFGLIQGDEKIAQNMFQLAVNQKGVMRGNYYDAIADNSLPVYGSVDAKTQRAAWSVGDKKTIVFEAGLNNLTQDQTTVLVHYGTDRTQQMALVRLEDSKK